MAVYALSPVPPIWTWKLRLGGVMIRGHKQWQQCELLTAPFRNVPPMHHHHWLSTSRPRHTQGTSLTNMFHSVASIDVFVPRRRVDRREKERTGDDG